MPQPRQSQQPQFVDAPALQEGSRWIGGRPSADDFADWFKKNVKLHDEMDAERYVGGIVLISGKEKHRVAKVNPQTNVSTIIEEERLVHTPYAKVETRVAYFWDWMLKHSDWVGVIEPGPVPRVSDSTVYNANLPDGFFRLPVTDPVGKVVTFLCCSMQVRLLRADSVKSVEVKDGSPRSGITRSTRTEGVPVAVYPAATKMIPTLDNRVDAFSLMKAETGAIGRALGMAGMLVIPGSGVATAEDMQEAAQMGALTGAEPQLDEPATAADPVQAADLMRQEIATMLEELGEQAPGKLEEIQAWARERNVQLGQATDSQIRGVHRKLKDALASE